MIGNDEEWVRDMGREMRRGIEGERRDLRIVENEPDAMWFAFFSCSERRGLSSTLPEELGLAETSRAPLGVVVIVGDDIIAMEMNNRMTVS